MAKKYEAYTFITSAEHEVKDSRRSGMYQSSLFLTTLGTQVCRFSDLFGYLTKLRAEYEISRDHFNFFDLFLLAFPGFELTHLCDPSDQGRL